MDNRQRGVTRLGMPSGESMDAEDQGGYAVNNGETVRNAAPR